MHKIPWFEKVSLHAVLWVGVLIFSYPFVWMLGTSAKVPREMAADNLVLFPRAPRPQERSPYIDPRQFEPMHRPEGVEPQVWAEAKPEMEALIKARLAEWVPELPASPEGNPAPLVEDTAVYQEEMVEGVFARVALRLSDAARSAAADAERQRRGQAAIELSRRELSENLSPEAIEAGVQALTADAARQLSDEMLREIFDLCYRRVALGAVRVQMRNYEAISLARGTGWSVEQGKASLLERHEGPTPVQELRLDFSQPQLELAFQPDLSAVGENRKSLDPKEIERIYVSVRGDASWARLRFEVDWMGRHYVTRDWLNLFERDWQEFELRWTDAGVDPMARRPFLVLQEIEQPNSNQSSVDFAIRMQLEKASPGGAWAAKLTRNYRNAFREVAFDRYLMTSFSLALLNIVLAIFSCSLIAYAFARLHWPGRELFFGILLATMMIPAQVTMIPSFLIIKELGWYNSLLPLWVPALFGSPFFVFLLRQFFKNIPVDLEDAARIDGCGFLRIYWHVMLPLVKPTLATIAIFTFMGVWNNFMGPLIYVADERLFPLALGLFKFSQRSAGDVGLMMAGSFMMTLPIIILFFFLQRFFIQGISLTGVKG